MNTNDITQEANVIGTTIISTNYGFDPEYNINGLIPNTLYFRLSSGDGQFNYINANGISQTIKRIDNAVNDKVDNAQLNLLKNSVNNSDSILSNKIDELESQLDSKVDKTDINTDCDNCISDNEFRELQDDVINKVNISDFQQFKNDVVNSLTGDNSIVGALNVKVNANTSEIDKLNNDLDILKDTVSALSDTTAIELINTQIKLLEDQLKEKLTKDSLIPINDRIDKVVGNISLVNNRINTVNSELSKKASNAFVQTELNNINDDIDDLRKNINNKIDASDLSGIATKQDVAVVNEKVNKLTHTTGTAIDSLKGNYNKLSTLVNTKADDVVIKKSIAEINTELTNKANIVNVNSQINGLSTRVTKLEVNDKKNHEIICKLDDVKTDVEAVDKKFTGLTSAQTNKLNTIDSQIRELNNKDNKFEQQLKNEWIRVLTPSEYDALPTNPYYSDGRVNPNAKQPNVIYLTVKSNKPAALYIGSILIAKAEDKIGSSGFAYSFPIIF